MSRRLADGAGELAHRAGAPPIDIEDVAKLIALLENDWLRRVGVNDLARLLGYSTRRLQRLRHDHGHPTYRAQLVTRLVAILRHAWTDEGVAAWFHRPRLDLGERRPIDLLDPDHERALITAARAGRVQGGV